MSFINPTKSQFMALALHKPDSPIVMLNLLKFRALAKYDQVTDENRNLSGRDAYAIYIEKVTPFLKQTGAVVIYQGNCQEVIIGPSNQEWDEVILIQYPSASAMLEMISQSEYVASSAHRTAALDNSRLILTVNDTPKL